jgi:uncharacterized DUF497 family protein
MSLVGRLVWDEAKRRANLAKHGLDFADAAWVLESDIRFDVHTVRHGEQRAKSFAYVYDQLKVLLVVHVIGEPGRIVSFRAASTVERRKYYEWLATEYEETR